MRPLHPGSGCFFPGDGGGSRHRHEGKMGIKQRLNRTWSRDRGLCGINAEPPLCLN